MKEQRRPRAVLAGRVALAAGCGLVVCMWAVVVGGCGEMEMWQPWDPWNTTAAPRARGTIEPLQDVEDFRREVLQARGAVLVDFYKDHCPTCVLQDDVLQGLAGEYEGRIRFVKFKIREATMMSTHPGFMEEQKLFWVPTSILYVDGKEQTRWTLNHAAWQFRPALTAAATGTAVPAGPVAATPSLAVDANGCTAEGCPIDWKPRLVEPQPPSTPPSPGRRFTDYPTNRVP